MAICHYLFPHNYNYSEKDLERATLRHRRVSSFFRSVLSAGLHPPVSLDLNRPSEFTCFPRIFEALFFDLSVFFKCLKVIIPCKSAAVSLTSSLTPLVLSYRQPEVYLRCARDRWVLTAGSLHIASAAWPFF